MNNLIKIAFGLCFAIGLFAASQAQQISGSASGGGSGTPGGSNTQVQFNDSSAFGGDAGLVYNKTTNVLTNTSGQIILTDSTLEQYSGVTKIIWTDAFGTIWSTGGYLRTSGAGGNNVIGIGVYVGPEIQLANNGRLTFSDTINNAGATVDIAVGRNAAGVLSVDNGVAGTYRDVLARGVRSNAVAFASAIASPVEGTIQAFTDSTTAVWGATITGTGSNHVLGYYNGTNWTVMAK